MPVPLQLQCGITNHPTDYSFRVINGRCAESDNPTLHDLLEDIILDHELCCDCGMKPGPRAWIACYVPKSGETDTLGLDTSKFDPCALDTSLESLWDLVHDPRHKKFNLMHHIYFEGTGRVLDRKLKFTSYKSGLVFQIPEGTLQLPGERETHYLSLYDTPGMVIIDKSKFLTPTLTQRVYTRLPVLRRPKGFGKSTFLSQMECFLDSYKGSPRHFSRFPSFKVYIGSPWGNAFHSPMAIILHLDLAELNVSSNLDVRTLRRNCRDLIDRAAQLCYARYRTRWDLHRFGGCPNITFKALVYCVAQATRKYACSLFVGVDNYTAPLLVNNRHPHVESIVAEEIFQPIIYGCLSQTIIRALMVGDVVSGTSHRPYCNSNVFAKYTVDLTANEDLIDILGLNEDEVVAIGEAKTGQGQEFLQTVRDRAGIPSDYEEEPIYSTSDVLALARCSDESVAASLRINYIPVLQILSGVCLSDPNLLDTTAFDKYVEKRGGDHRMIRDDLDTSNESDSMTCEADDEDETQLSGDDEDSGKEEMQHYHYNAEPQAGGVKVTITNIHGATCPDYASSPESMHGLSSGDVFSAEASEVTVTNMHAAASSYYASSTESTRGPSIFS